MDFNFYKILPVLNIMKAVDCLLLPKAAHLSSYLLLKPLLSKFKNTKFDLIFLLQFNPSFRKVTSLFRKVPEWKA